MALPYVLTARAEAANDLLHQTLGLHRTQMSHASSAPSIRRLGPSAFDGIQVQRQATVLRMISITEAYCVDRLLELAEEDVEPNSNRTTAAIWDRASKDAISNWRSIKDALGAWHQATPDWKPLDGLVEVRNAIAHGLGQLTLLQRRKLASTRTLINRTSVTLQGENIILSETDVVNVRATCSALIEELDALLPPAATSAAAPTV